MRKEIIVNNLANFEFWYKIFKVRTKKWQQTALKNLKKGVSEFETKEENEDKIKALQMLLEK